MATWNLERLKHFSKNDLINTKLTELNADILVLTETDNRIELKNYKNRIDTHRLSELSSDYYKSTENRVTILTNYDSVKQYNTYDNYSTLCVEIKTEKGILIIYGTIIGIYGNRHENFKQDLEKQLCDFDKFSTYNNLCVIGDYNISFADNYYFTTYGRSELYKNFDKNNIEIVTRERPECIDHIAISKQYLNNRTTIINEWNEDKKLSDHKGIYIDLTDYYKQ